MNKVRGGQKTSVQLGDPKALSGSMLWASMRTTDLQNECNMPKLDTRMEEAQMLIFYTIVRDYF